MRPLPCEESQRRVAARYALSVLRVVALCVVARYALSVLRSAVCTAQLVAGAYEDRRRDCTGMGQEMTGS
eukprot:185013-Rhodomonas_salina.1